MRQRTRSIVYGAMAVGLMVFFLVSSDLDRVGKAIAGARWEVLGVALLVLGVNHVVRVSRWQYLMRPLGRIAFTSAMRALLVGIAATAVLPGRVGELLRPYVLARREGLSTSSTFATIVVERLFDVVSVLVIFGASIAFPDPPVEKAGTSLLVPLRFGAGVAGGTAIVLLIIARLAAGNPERVVLAVERTSGWLPGRVARVVVPLVHRFTEGLAILRKAGSVFVALGWSVVAWLVITAWLWLIATAFGIELPPSGAVTLLAFTVIGVSVPTPGGIGAYHASFVGATMLYGAPTELAFGSALVAHAMAFVPQTLIGIVLMSQEGMRLGTVRRLVERLPIEGEEGGAQRSSLSSPDGELESQP